MYKIAHAGGAFVLCGFLHEDLFRNAEFSGLKFHKYIFGDVSVNKIMREIQGCIDHFVQVELYGIPNECVPVKTLSVMIDGPCDITEIAELVK